MSYENTTDGVVDSDANDDVDTEFSDDSDASHLSSFDASDYANKLSGSSSSYKKGKKPILKKPSRK